MTIILFALSTALLNGQNKTLAVIGDSQIRVDEFKMRYEFVPQKYDNNDSAKVNFLYSLVAEKLWAIEGEKKGLGNSTFVRSSVIDLGKKLVRDKLYKLEIENKINIPQSEITADLRKIHQKRLMYFIFDSSRNKINSIYNLLKKGTNFFVILKSRKEFEQQKEGVSVYYGDMNSTLENRMFDLKSGEYTSPIHIGNGYAIYYLKKIDYVKTHPKYPNYSDNKLAKEIIFSRKAKALYNEFYDKHILKKNVRVDKNIFEKISGLIFKTFKEKKEKLYNEHKGKYVLDYYSALLIENSVSDTRLNTKFIKFSSNPVNLRQFLNFMLVNNLEFKDIDSLSLKKTLGKKIKKYILDELIFREGLKKGLLNSKDVQHDLKLWKESFIAGYYRNNYLDSVDVSKQEIKDYYQRIKKNIPDSIQSKVGFINKKLNELLYFKKLRFLYENKTVKLAKKYGVEVNRKLLADLHTTNVQTLVYRSLGFGGSITAVPYTMPFYKWKNMLPKKIKYKYLESNK